MNEIFIIEDEAIVAKSISKVLQSEGYTVVDIANSYVEAKEKIKLCKPSLILCDINLNSEKNGIDLMKELNPRFNIPFIFISAYSDEETIKEADNISPCNYLTKPFSDQQLIVSVNRALKKLNQDNADNPTNRELSILKLISKGFSTKQIAEELSISFNTVESHRKNLMKKYMVSSMPELICLATSKGWITYEV